MASRLQRQRRRNRDTDLTGVVEAFGVFRLGAGAGLLVAPALFERVFGVDRRTARRTAWLTRMVGARELALGTLAISVDEATARRSLVQQLAADAGDALALAVATGRGDVRRPVGLAVLAFALAGVLTEAGLLARDGGD